jgi:hypothetical protein
VSQPPTVPLHYAEAYETTAEELRRTLKAVTTEETARSFVEQAARYVRATAGVTPEFYPGEFYGWFGRAIQEGLMAEAATAQRTMEGLISERGAVVTELNERLRTAREAGDREAEHQVWKQEDEKQKEAGAIAKQGQVLLLQVKALRGLGAALGLTGPPQRVHGIDRLREAVQSDSGQSNEWSTPVGGRGEGAVTGNITINEVWRRILAHEGETFRQIRGQAFTYTVEGKVLAPSTTNQNLSQATFEQALARVPFRSTVDVQDLRGPSYLYAILMDERIRGRDW